MRFQRGRCSGVPFRMVPKKWKFSASNAPPASDGVRVREVPAQIGLPVVDAVRVQRLLDLLEELRLADDHACRCA